MKINSGDTIAGYSILTIRHLVRKCRGYGFYPELVAKNLEVTQEEAENVVMELNKAGLIEKMEGDDNAWTVTIAGNAFAMSSTATRLRRKSCDRVMTAFLDRVEAARDMPFAVCVEEVYLFGSYARGEERPSDIDLYIKLAHKSDDREERSRLFLERKKVAIRNGRRFGNIGEEASWPWTEIMLFLKKRSRALSISTLDDWVKDAEGAILVYRYPDIRLNPPYPETSSV
ncbi:nucleotidyltransferase domain-containing protein [Planctomicrobium sp. SH668]|uniref:nucleotidyltransferase domain-containing protein n=1 Tax=Planctomicrobium sp. SH668 TaxID=3448126 RepID=UPI003F5C5F78